MKKFKDIMFILSQNYYINNKMKKINENKNKYVRIL